MAGLYLHIPFCSKACHYCNFHFSTSIHRKEAFLRALEKEIANPYRPGNMAMDRNIDTVYFGGGTPSLLTMGEMHKVLKILNRNFDISPNAEITLEANPDDISRKRLNEWRTLGINRLSIGVQSFVDADLQWMNRAHNASHAIQCIQQAQDAEFTNLTIDLIYGLPGMTTQHWEKNVLQAIELQVPHLSCYALTVEEKTALHHFIKKGKVPPLQDALQAEHFVLLMQLLHANGFEHYEISNFAKPGMRSRHNSSYWQGKPYYGFGPSAHSFDGNHTRWWNIPNNTIYIERTMAGKKPVDSEILSPVQRMNETIMTLLRTQEGLQIDQQLGRIETYMYPAAQWPQAATQLKEYIDNRWIAIQGNTIQLTPTGKLYADHIAASLFATE
ncbi:MAG TPA: radical SAM family heme chaperone HemW [Phnomibacter sp.]|nr:radical SAM family heme chaperone HemW [Phnomibacter sp.]